MTDAPYTEAAFLAALHPPSGGPNNAALSQLIVALLTERHADKWDTRTLIDALVPTASLEIRYKVLRCLSPRHGDLLLTACRSPGKPVLRYGKTVIPWLWSAPTGASAQLSADPMPPRRASAYPSSLLGYVV